MRFRFMAALAPLAAAAPLWADGAITVPLPDMGWVADAAQAQEIVEGIALAVVIGMNCPGFHMTDGEWTLLTGTSDLLNERFGLQGDPYVAAFARLDEPGACDEEAGFARSVIYQAINSGGWPYEVQD